MIFYLKVINPVISILALLLCSWAAIFNDKVISIFGIVGGSFSSYFFAKGLYTSASLFVLGKILLEFLQRKSEKTDKNILKTDMIYVIAFLTFTIGSLVGLYFWGKSTSETSEPKYMVKNPSEFIISESYPVRESEKLKIGGKIKNSSDVKFASVKISAKLYIGNKYSGNSSTTINGFEPKSANDFLIEFYDFTNQNVKDSIKYEFTIESEKKKD